MKDNKYEVLTKVRCMGKTHRIGLTHKGRLSLLDHDEDTAQEIATLQVFNPGIRCRCTEIALIWEWYIRDRFYWYELRDEHPWVAEQFKDKYGRPTQPSDSKLLESLPKPLRWSAKKAREVRCGRRAGQWRREWGAGILSSPGQFGEVYRNEWARGRRMQELVQQRKWRVITPPGADIDRHALPTATPYSGLRSGYIHKGMRKSRWFKFLEDKGLWPRWVPRETNRDLWAKVPKGRPVRNPNTEYDRVFIETPSFSYPTVLMVENITDLGGRLVHAHYMITLKFANECADDPNEFLVYGRLDH